MVTDDVEPDEADLEAWYQRILAFDRLQLARRRRSAALALISALALVATLAASTAVAALEAATLNQVGTDG